VSLAHSDAARSSFQTPESVHSSTDAGALDVVDETKLLADAAVEDAAAHPAVQDTIFWNGFDP